eukprot:Gb_03283 [translate_table: standard]
MAGRSMWSSLIVLVFFCSPVSVISKSTIEPCTVSDTCNAMVGYTLPTDLKISEVATRFQVDPVSLLGANAIDVSYPDVENQILPAKYFIKVPITCNCVNGIRQSNSTAYKVQAADTLYSIANTVFGGLVTSDQVRDANSISDPDLIDLGQSLTIPLPCSCFNGTDNGLPAIYLSYVVQPGDTVSTIGVKYGTTVTDLMTVNALATSAVKAGDILAIPLAADILGIALIFLLVLVTYRRPSLAGFVIFLGSKDLPTSIAAFQSLETLVGSLKGSEDLPTRIAVYLRWESPSRLEPRGMDLLFLANQATMEALDSSSICPTCRDRSCFSSPKCLFLLRLIRGSNILSTCTSGISKASLDSGLLVSNGSYTITASHCVQCSCGPGNLNLYCEPAPLAISCSSMQCKNSNLMIGNVTTQPTSAGCNVTACSYSGFVNGTILTSLSTSLQPQCPGIHVLPNFTRPPSTLTAPSPVVLSLPKSLPKSASHGTSVLEGFAPANGPTGSSSTAPKLLRWPSIASMLVLGFPFVILLVNFVKDLASVH